MGAVVEFPRRRPEPEPESILDAYGNIRVGPGRVLTCGQAWVPPAQIEAVAEHGWAREPGEAPDGLVRVWRARPGPVPLRCQGVARDEEYPQVVCVTLSRALSEAELGFFHEACRQAAALTDAMDLA